MPHFPSVFIKRSPTEEPVNVKLEFNDSYPTYVTSQQNLPHLKQEPKEEGCLDCIYPQTQPYSPKPPASFQSWKTEDEHTSVEFIATTGMSNKGVAMTDFMPGGPGVFKLQQPFEAVLEHVQGDYIKVKFGERPNFQFPEGMSAWIRIRCSCGPINRILLAQKVTEVCNMLLAQRFPVVYSTGQEFRLSKLEPRNGGEFWVPLMTKPLRCYE